MEKNERIQEIERQIAILKAEKAQLNGSTNSFADLMDYFAVKTGNTSISRGGAHVLYGRQHEAWDHLRKLSVCSVCGGENKKLKDLSFDEWEKARKFCKELIDFYVENAEAP